MPISLAALLACCQGRSKSRPRGRTRRAGKRLAIVGEEGVFRSGPRRAAFQAAQANVFGLDTVACSSTGNLANSVAAQAARAGLKAWISIPSDLEPAKVPSNTRAN